MITSLQYSSGNNKMPSRPLPLPIPSLLEAAHLKAIESDIHHSVDLRAVKRLDVVKLLVLFFIVTSIVSVATTTLAADHVSSCGSFTTNDKTTANLPTTAATITKTSTTNSPTKFITSAKSPKAIPSRFRRQDSSASTPTPSSSGSSSDTSSSASSSGSGGGSNSEQQEQEEALPGFKCDFASSDQPDLCQFKILPLAPPGGGSKSTITWSHGSGKLALYQGGPLVDATRNDSTGGYIFYETSDPLYANQQQQPPHSLGNLSISLANDALFRLDNHYHFIYGKHNQHQSYDHPLSSQHSLAWPTGSTSFVSPNLTAPGPSGMCLSFKYIINGLSAEELTVHINDHKSERSRQIWSSSESAQNNWTLGEVLYSVANLHSVSFSASNSAHAPRDLQQRKFRGYIALDEVEVSRHDPSNQQGSCAGHCNFDGDLCGWTNAENGQEDDFDWSFGRGSDNLFTGPPRDYISSSNNELTGSYLFTDSAYPRHPGDRAILISPQFQPTPVNEALCMRFAVHMFGSGIGTLAIKIRYAGAEPIDSGGNMKIYNDLIIWEMAGDAGNNWHQAQTSVSSSKQPFQVVIEGTIGENHLGNIALDEISFSSGACPTSPPVASKNYGDCTFEQSMCYWKNSGPEAHLDDLDWVRNGEEQTIHGPNFDHTLKKRTGYYLKLANTYREPKSGTRAFLLSPVFQPRNNPVTGNTVQCLNFYYYMFLKSVSSSGPNLGTIRVYLATNNELIPIWRLTNPITSPNWKQGRAVLSTASIDGQPIGPTKFFQIAFEGVWGDAASGAIAIDDITIFDGACDILPLEAKSVAGECSFDADMCSWSNKTFEANSGQSNDLIEASKSPFFQSVNQGGSAFNNKASPTRRPSWQLATVDLRPVNLQDHTYKAPIGYAFVDVLDSSASGGAGGQNLILQGAEVSVGEGQQLSMCLSFWFAGYGRSELNRLSVYLSQASNQQQQSSPGDSGSNQRTGNQASSSAQSAPSSSSSLLSSQQTSSSGGSGGGGQSGSSLVSSSSVGSTSSVPNLNGSQGGGSGGGLGGSNSNLDLANNNGGQGDELDPNAWKMSRGQLLWSISLKNITEINRRKWLYGQVSIKADSNFIIRYEASSNDGGFALDDISFYEGICETRPLQAKVAAPDDDSGPVKP